MRMFYYFDTTTVIGAVVAKIESEIEASSDKTQDCLQNFFQAYSVSQLLELHRVFEGRVGFLCLDSTRTHSMWRRKMLK